MPLFRDFAGLAGWGDRLPDESTVLRFGHVLEKHKLAAQILQTVNDLLTARGLMLKSGAVVDATLIAAPSSTKNSTGKGAYRKHKWIVEPPTAGARACWGFASSVSGGLPSAPLSSSWCAWR